MSTSKPIQLMISKQSSIDIKPIVEILKLATTQNSSISIPSRTESKCLSISRLPSFNLLPVNQAPEYHPHIVEAIRLMYGKKPEQLTVEESEHFNGYCNYKRDKGEPIEEDFVHKPSYNFHPLDGVVKLVAKHKAPYTHIVIVQLNNVHYLYC